MTTAISVLKKNLAIACKVDQVVDNWTIQNALTSVRESKELDPEDTTIEHVTTETLSRVLAKSAQRGKIKLEVREDSGRLTTGTDIEYVTKVTLPLVFCKGIQNLVLPFSVCRMKDGSIDLYFVQTIHGATTEDNRYVCRSIEEQAYSLDGVIIDKHDIVHRSPRDCHSMLLSNIYQILRDEFSAISDKYDQFSATYSFGNLFDIEQTLKKGDVIVRTSTHPEHGKGILKGKKIKFVFDVPSLCVRLEISNNDLHMYDFFYLCVLEDIETHKEEYGIVCWSKHHKEPGTALTLTQWFDMAECMHIKNYKKIEQSALERKEWMKEKEALSRPVEICTTEVGDVSSEIVNLIHTALSKEADFKNMLVNMSMKGAKVIDVISSDEQRALDSHIANLSVKVMTIISKVPKGGTYDQTVKSLNDLILETIKSYTYCLDMRKRLFGL
jgi:hypothetical protein